MEEKQLPVDGSPWFPFSVQRCRVCGEIALPVTRERRRTEVMSPFDSLTPTLHRWSAEIHRLSLTFQKLL